MKFDDLLKKIISFTFYAIFTIVPLILTPWNYELFEFNKMIIVYLGTVIITSAWLIRMVINSKVIFKKTLLNLPLLLFLVSQIISSLISIHRYTSVWGYYSRFHGGLISTISYLLLFWAFISNLNKKEVKNSIYIVVTTAFIVAAYGVLEHFGIDEDYWVQDVRNRVFSTLGQPNWLAAYIDSLIFIPLIILFKHNSKKNNNNVLLSLKTKKIISVIFYLILLLCLIFTNSKSGVLSFWLSFAFFSIISLIFLKQKKWKIGTSVWIVSISIYLLLGGNTYQYINKADQWLQLFLPKKQVVEKQTNNQGKQKPQYAPKISESSEIRKVVWQGAVKIWKKYPVFGSGVETYAYSYYQHRPKEHNLLSEWDFLYNKAHNEYLNYLSTSGAFGIGTYLLVIGTTLFIFFKKLSLIENKKTKLLLLGLLSGYVSILITNFFGFSVVVIGLFFFLFPAFAITLTEKKDNKPKKINQIATENLLIILIIVGIAIYCINSIFKIWIADYQFAKGRNYVNANYLLKGRPKLRKAVQLRPKQALFHSKLAETEAKLAIAYNQSNATGSAEMVKDLKQSAEYHAQQTLKLNHVHLNLYKSVLKTYLYLQTIDQQYLAQAEQLLNKAIDLAPTDAKLYYNLGVVYQQMGKPNKAVEVWEKAVELKPNYTKVYFKLADLYIAEGSKQQAQEKLHFVIDNINPDHKRAVRMLEELNQTNK